MSKLSLLDNRIYILERNQAQVNDELSQLKKLKSELYSVMLPEEGQKGKGPYKEAGLIESNDQRYHPRYPYFDQYNAQKTQGDSPERDGSEYREGNESRQQDFSTEFYDHILSDEYTGEIFS